MGAEPSTPPRPGQNGDDAEEDRSLRPEVPRFDKTTGAWVLTRYRDVLAALREPRLSAASARSDSEAGTPDAAAHLAMRKAAAELLSPARLAEWRACIEPLAHKMLGELEASRPVDLVREFAEPWSLALAMRVTGAPAADAERLAGLARDVFAAAAEPGARALQARADLATVELAGVFSGESVALNVQAFVALSQTLPCFLANGWLALLRNPEEMKRLYSQMEPIANAIEELLRYAGPARAQFRRAMADVELGGAAIKRDERVALMLAAANRDPEQFPEPDRLDLRRDATGHVAFGAGAHACVGAPLIRMAAAAATGVFVERFSAAQASDQIEWRGGFAIRAPASLPVFVQAHRRRVPQPGEERQLPAPPIAPDPSEAEG